jgi:hypothetical protein
VVGPSDPQWEERDYELALAYERAEAGRCRGCGTFKDEWEADRFAYVASAWVCPGCENLENEKHNDHTQGGRPGLKTYLLPREVAEAMDEEDELERTSGREQGPAGRTDWERHFPP